MQHAARRGARGIALYLVLASLSLTSPALAIDTGGGGSSSSTPSVAAPPGHPAMAATPAAGNARLVDLDTARHFIARRDWTGAIKLLRVIVVQQPRNADALNLLGYSLRQTGRMAEAEAFYLKALRLDPRHLGANEYLGELYVLTGQLAKAKGRLAAIGSICGNTSCEEYRDLAHAIAGRT